MKNQKQHSQKKVSKTGNGNKENIELIISNDDPRLLIEEAEKLAKGIFDNKEATKTQIRRLFSSLRSIEYAWPLTIENDQSKNERADAYRQLLLMSPRLAYEAKRHSSLKKVCEIIQSGIDAVDLNDRRTFERLVQFFEAVVGYYFGSKGG